MEEHKVGGMGEHDVDNRVIYWLGSEQKDCHIEDQVCVQSLPVLAEVKEEGGQFDIIVIQGKIHFFYQIIAPNHTSSLEKLGCIFPHWQRMGGLESRPFFFLLWSLTLK